jgi:uncharacterized membrane protein YbhN (UPF0104 family)
VINSGTSLHSSFIPVPGGIGVVEFALEVGLTSAGMSVSAAAAARVGVLRVPMAPAQPLPLTVRRIGMITRVSREPTMVGVTR